MEFLKILPLAKFGIGLKYLKGVRTCDFTTSVMGAHGTLALLDQDVDVMKVEPRQCGGVAET